MMQLRKLHNVKEQWNIALIYNLTHKDEEYIAILLLNFQFKDRKWALSNQML